MPVFDPSLNPPRPATRYVENEDCVELGPPAVEYSDILVGKEIDEFEHDFLPEDGADYSGKYKCDQGASTSGRSRILRNLETAGNFFIES